MQEATKPGSKAAKSGPKKSTARKVKKATKAKKTQKAKKATKAKPAKPARVAKPARAAKSSRTARKGTDRQASGGKGLTAVKGRTKKSSAIMAEILAKGQRDISVSEFFAKNRHLLGFDNPRKALLTTIKEAVDNALDACEEAGVLPEIAVTVRQTSDDRFEVAVQDNGPGIVKAQIPNIFGRLLYGSKFHTLKMARGQQGIGISAAGMYGLLTTGKSVRITSRISANKPAHYYEIQIDTRKNRPEIIKDSEVEFDLPHGTCVQIELEARYQKGKTSVDEYLRQTAITNPHVYLRYRNPAGQLTEYPRTSNELQVQPKEIKPHPYGVELGVLIKMLKDTDKRTLQAFLRSDFSRVTGRVADAIISKAGLKPGIRSKRVGRAEADRLFKAIKEVKIMAPATDCVVPIGEENMLKGLKSVVKADFYTANTRPPAVYRGNPFIIETALAYGQSGGVGDVELFDELDEPVEIDKGNGQLVKLMRFANRVPLLYQQSACAMYKSVVNTNWRSYGLSQSRGALPAGPAVVLVHIASVWVPFTSESKEAVAHYPEIIKQMRLAIQDCGRKLGKFLKRRQRVHDELKKRSYIEKYIPHIGLALQEILDLPDRRVNKITTNLKDVLERSRKL